MAEEYTTLRPGGWRCKCSTRWTTEQLMQFWKKCFNVSTNTNTRVFFFHVCTLMWSTGWVFIFALCFRSETVGKGEVRSKLVSSLFAIKTRCTVLTKLTDLTSKMKRWNGSVCSLSPPAGIPKTFLITEELKAASPLLWNHTAPPPVESPHAAVTVFYR